MELQCNELLKQYNIMTAHKKINCSQNPSTNISYWVLEERYEVYTVHINKHQYTIVNERTNTPILCEHLQVEFISRSTLEWTEGQERVHLEERVSEVLQ